MNNIFKRITSFLVVAVIIVTAVYVPSNARISEVICDYCGESVPFDETCPAGTHCGGGTCFAERHCSKCSICEEERYLCDDCGMCTACEFHCMECYACSHNESVCKDCGSCHSCTVHCRSCGACGLFAAVCDDCGKCGECQPHCGECFACIESELLCRDCGRCAEDCGCDICRFCSYCEECMNCDYCSFCQACVYCLESSQPGSHCSECYRCFECGEAERCNIVNGCGLCVECCTCNSTGSVVSGIIHSFGSESDNITVMLVNIHDSTGVCGVTVNGNTATFKVKNVPNGNYILTVSKLGHVLYEYEMYVDNNDEYFEIYLYLKGDLNFDGKVNARDKAFMTNLIKQNEMSPNSDLNGDGKVNARDKAVLTDIIKYS